MLNFVCNVADVCFYTKTDTYIHFFQSATFLKFVKAQSQPDVLQKIYCVSENQLVLSPLTPIEKTAYSQLISSTCYEADTLTIPPILPKSQTIASVHQKSRSKEADLINSPAVRTNIQSYWQDTKGKKVQVHKMVVEIFDFEHMIFQVFFHSSLTHVLKSDLSFNGIRRLFSAAFPAFKALIIHSSGIIVNGRVALFLAPDEGGKSTAVGLGPPENVLCDDYNVLSHRQGIIAAHSTPWGSLCNGPVSAPLGGLFFLEKAKIFSLRFITAQEAMINIWDENLRFLKNLPKDLKIRAFNTLFDICREIPAYAMCFPKDHIDWQAVDQAMI